MKSLVDYHSAILVTKLVAIKGRFLMATLSCGHQRRFRRKEFFSRKTNQARCIECRVLITKPKTIKEMNDLMV